MENIHGTLVTEDRFVCPLSREQRVTLRRRLESTLRRRSEKEEEYNISSSLSTSSKRKLYEFLFGR